MCSCVFEIHVLLKSLLRDVFESLKCYLDHWLICILDCIHVYVFLLSKNCFEKQARHLLDTSSIASYLSSFLSFFLLQSCQHLDTWWIDRESFWPLDSFSTPVDWSSLISCFWCFYSSIASQHIICRRCFCRHLLDRCLNTTSTRHLSRFTKGSI